MKGLNFTKKIYEHLVQEFFHRKDKLSFSERLKALEDLFSFSWHFPFGRYADMRLEGELKEIFERSSLKDVKVEHSTGRGGILHVVSSIHGSGGHSRMVLNWILSDPEHEHTVLIAKQDTTALNWVLEKLKSSCKQLEILGTKEEYIDTTKNILQFINEGNYSGVVFHIDPDDVVSALAAFHPHFPPLAIYNHADHVMWVGASVCDIVINFRKISENYSHLYRGILNSVVISYFFDEPKELLFQNLESEELKAENYESIGLSIISSYKLENCNKDNFYEFLYKFLSVSPRVLFYLIGPSKEDWYKNSNYPIPDNLMIEGIVEDLGKYMGSCDFYLETFPLAGGLAAVEACANGIVPFFYKDAAEIFSTKTLLDYSEYLPQKESIIQYTFDDLSEITQILSDKEKLKIHAGAVANFINKTYSAENRNKKLKEMYKILLPNPHKINLVKGLEIDNSFNPESLGLAKSQRHILYFLLKTNKYKWISRKMKIRFTILRTKLIIKDLF